MWDIEEPGRKASSAVSSKAAPALAIIHRRESFECVTPLAGPVLPEVKKMAAALSGSERENGRSGSGPSTRSSNCLPPPSPSPP